MQYKLISDSFQLVQRYNQTNSAPYLTEMVQREGAFVWRSRFETFRTEIHSSRHIYLKAAPERDPVVA